MIWAPVFFGELKCLSGDRGAKALLDLHEEQVTAVAMDDPAVLIDIDTPEALREHGGR